MEVFISPSVVKNNFAGYSNLDGWLFAFRPEMHHSMLSLLLKLLLKNLPLFWWV
jgi:hypothetical protein